MGEQDVEFVKMEGFHRLSSLWKIDYRVVTVEPFLTQAVTEETKELVDTILGRSLPKGKDLPDAVPLVIGDRAVVTGNAVKGIFRHIISSQLTEAGVSVCSQRVKYGEKGSPPSGRAPECAPDKPCFVCTWFGTASRQGALYFSMLRSVEGVERILVSDPIPLIALRDDYRAIEAKARAFMLLAPVKEGVEFRGWIKGENLSEEIIGAIKEIQDMSEKGFVHFGGFKTRGFGTIRMQILKVERYRTVPFGLERTYEGDELQGFLKDCQGKYHGLLSRGKKQ